MSYQWVLLYRDIQIKRERQALGLVLAGGSITGIVLTTFAAHYLYGFIPASIAFVCNIAWVILGIYIAKRYQSEYLTIFVAVGAFFVPFLLNSTTLIRTFSLDMRRY